MITTTDHKYIVRNPEILRGEPIIAGTRTPVRSVVESWRLGIAPECIPQGMPHLSVAQVFDALSYYSDNRAEIDEYISRNRIPDELLEPLVQRT
jgi:uncharacterized protein (DUF433 family)